MLVRERRTVRILMMSREVVKFKSCYYTKFDDENFWNVLIAHTNGNRRVWTHFVN